MVSWLIEFYFISRWDILTEILEAQKQRAARQGIDMEKVQLSHKFDLKEGKVCHHNILVLRFVTGDFCITNSRNIITILNSQKLLCWNVRSRKCMKILVFILFESPPPG